jgi:hypothetical protein
MLYTYVLKFLALVGAWHTDGYRWQASARQRRTALPSARLSSSSCKPSDFNSTFIKISNMNFVQTAKQSYTWYIGLQTLFLVSGQKIKGFGDSKL